MRLRAPQALTDSDAITMEKLHAALLQAAALEASSTQQPPLARPPPPVATLRLAPSVALPAAITFGGLLILLALALACSSFWMRHKASGQELGMHADAAGDGRGRIHPTAVEQPDGELVLELVMAYMDMALRDGGRKTYRLEAIRAQVCRRWAPTDLATRAAERHRRMERGRKAVVLLRLPPTPAASHSDQRLLSVDSQCVECCYDCGDCRLRTPRFTGWPGCGS